MTAMSPLRVEWALERPLRAPDRPIHLDALLAWARVQEGLEAEAEDPLAYQADLPLAEANADGDSVWQASWLAIDAAAPATVLPMVRRLDYARMATSSVVDVGNKNHFATGTGIYKGFNMRLPIREVQSVTAWCIGDADRVQALLRRVTHLGACRRNGWGRVASVRVEPEPEAEFRWAWRTLPFAPNPAAYPWSYEPVQAATRPPYWDRRNWQLAYEPLEDLANA